MSKNTTKTTSIKNNVMDSIKNGQTHMRPKSYYSAVSVLLVAATLLLSIVAVWLTSVLSFWVRILLADGPAYGAKRNLAQSMDSFPWWAIVLGVISIIGIIYLVKKFGHLYKIPGMYLVALLVAVFVGVGFALSFTPLPGLFNSNYQMNSNCSDGDNSCTGGGRMNGRGR